MIENRTSHFVEIIASGKTLNVELFNINDSYLELESRDLWGIDGGIQFTFPKGIIQIGWCPKTEMFLLSQDDIKKNEAEYEYKELRKGKITKIHNLIGKKVINSDFKWLQFDFWDNDADNFIAKNMLVGLVLEFDSEDIIQIVLADYALDEQEEPVNISYDLTAEILITLGERMSVE